MLKRHCFHFVRRFQSVSTNVSRQDACFRDNVSNRFSEVLNCFKYHHSACLRDIVFKMFSAVSNRFKYHHNAFFKDIVFIFFSAVPNRFKYHQNTFFGDIVLKSFLQFQIFSNTVTVHA